MNTICLALGILASAAHARLTAQAYAPRLQASLALLKSNVVAGEPLVLVVHLASSFSTGFADQEASIGETASISVSYTDGSGFNLDAKREVVLPSRMFEGHQFGGGRCRD